MIRLEKENCIKGAPILKSIEFLVETEQIFLREDQLQFPKVSFALLRNFWFLCNLID